MSIRINDLTVRFKNGVVAVNKASLEIPKGIYGLLGENGAGKTTLMRVLTTVLKQTEGLVSLDGILYNEGNYEKIQKKIGYLPQEIDLYPNLTVKECLVYMGGLSGVSRNDLERRITYYLEKTSLTEHQNKKMRQLSGGMKRRVGLIQALLNNPDFLIIDEPTTGLDPEERIRIRNLLVDFSKDRTVLFSTHVVEDLAATCTQLGAKIETVYGEDVPFQIAEFTRLSGVSKIVIGRSSATKRHLLSKPTLTEKLIDYAPNLDVHIIPDTISNAAVYQLRGGRKKNHIVFSVTDTLKSTAILILSSLVGMIFQKFGFDEANIITVFVLGVLVTAVITKHQIYSLISSIVSVLVFSFLFTEPQFTLQAYDQGYPVTFIIMFLAAFLTGSLAIRIKNQAKQAAQSAYRTKVLFDTNQLLQQAKDKNEIVSATSNQLIKLLRKDIVFYLADGEVLDTPHIFSVTEENLESCISENEKAVAGWVLKNNKRAGATTGTLSNAKCLYLAVRSSSMVYGVIGIVMGEIPLDPFENSILLSILGECALALENEKNAREKQEAAILAKNEQLRANLLRAISHDLRTPLTSISGNASNLLSNSDSFDNDTKKQLYMDIYDDSMWLINLVENLLAVTRIEEGRLNLRITEDLMDDVITEALHHINRKSEEHHISVESKEEFLLAKMDAKLIVQVIINIVDNAIKYTPKNSHIVIRTEKRGKQAVVSISDDGNGIADEIKPRIFDMFYSGANQIADSRRSLGLGLSLCKSIINAHGGELTVSDNLPHGTVFTFTLPAGEVKVYE